MAISIGVDIGGTKISAAYIVGGEIVATQKCAYNRSRIIEDTSEMYQKLILNREPALRVGVSCAGLVDSSSGVVRFAGNLDMEQFLLGELLETALSVPVRIDNDARCALWGEFSKAQGALGQNVAGIVLGTGVGGGLIMNGKLVSGKNGFAGEYGHLPVSTSFRTCACGLAGCLESVAGGRSFTEAFEAKNGQSLTGEQIADLARAGDSQALDAFQTLGQAVGEVIAQIDTALDLDALVIGGGFGTTLDIWLDTARDAYKQALVGANNRKLMKIVASQLGQEAQLLGAGVLI